MRNLTGNFKAVAAVVLVAASGLFAQGVIESVIPPAVIFETLALNKDLATKKKPKYRSPTALVPSVDKKQIYIAEQSAKKIAVYDLATKTVTKRFNLPNEVTGIVLSGDGGRLYATCSSEIWPAGMVCVVNTATGLIEKKITDQIGHSVRCPVLSPNGKKLYVCNMFDNDISIIDVASLSVTKRVRMVREPYAAGITPDGTRLVVGNSLPNDKSTDSQFVSCEVSIIDCQTETVIKNIRLTKGSHSVFGLAVSPDGKYAFVSHLIGKFNLAGSTVVGGWLHTNNIAVIDIVNQKFINDVSLDYAQEGRANPWEIKFSDNTLPNDTFMVVTHAGSNNLSMIKYRRFIDTVLYNSRPDNFVDMQQKFNYILDNIRKSVSLDSSKGVRCCAIIGNKVYAAGFFNDESAIMEEHQLTLSTKISEVSEPVYHRIGIPQKQTGERRGEQNFYDADLCQQQWQSCQSCHPLTRPDALNWILVAEAAGFPKNAKSMLYAWWTPPTNWLAVRENAYQSVRAGIEKELFQTPQPEVAIPMDTFLMYLKPLASPYLVKGKLSAAALRGRALYYDKNKVDCIVCHAGPLFCDEKMYNCGVEDPYDSRAMNTPTLIESWRTPPYGHLGTFAGMHGLLQLGLHSNMVKNVAAKILTNEDVEDLIEYVMSL